MIAISLKSKSLWSLNRVNFDKTLIISQSGFATATVSSGGKFLLRILSRSKSGNGVFFVKMTDNRGRIFYEKKIKAPKGSWSEFIESIAVSPENQEFSIRIDRGGIGFGRVELSRFELSKPIEKPEEKPAKKEKKVSEATLLPSTRVSRLAIVIPYSIYGGAEVYLKNMLDRSHIGAEINFLYMGRNKLSSHLSQYNHISVGSLNKLKHNLITGDYDAVVYYNSSRIYSFLSQLKGDGVISSDLVEIYHSNFKWSDSLSSIPYRENISKIIRVSDSLCNDISGDFHLKTIPVSIDLNLFKPTQSVVIKRQLGLSKFRCIFGMVARLSDEKNIDYAIDIFERLNDCALIILGDGPLRKRLSDKISGGNMSNVRLLGHKSNVQDFYNIFDASILTSKNEGTPFSIVESLAYELPIFTTNVGEIGFSFKDLSSISFLTKNLELDVEMIRDFSIKITRHPESRSFVENRHNANINSKLFLEYIRGSFLELSAMKKGSPLLPGRYY